MEPITLKKNAFDNWCHKRISYNPALTTRCVNAAMCLRGEIIYL